MDFTFHAIGWWASIWEWVNLFTMTVSNTINDLANAFFGLHTMLTIIWHDVFVVASATFNTCVWTVGNNISPVVEVIAWLSASTDTWIVWSATVALDWAKFLVSPVDMDTMSVTFLSISTNSGTKTFAITTWVTSASVEDTVFVELGWVNMSMASLEDWSIDDWTLLDWPDLSVWVWVTDINDVSWIWACWIGSPWITEGKNIGWSQTTSWDQIVDQLVVVVTTETLNLTLVHWVKLDDHLCTLVPLESKTNVSINENPETSVSDTEAWALFNSDWLSSDQLHGWSFQWIIWMENNGDWLSTDSTLWTALFVSSQDLEVSIIVWGWFNVCVFTGTLELVISTIESSDMWVTISSTLTWADQISALPKASDALALVTVSLHFITFLVWSTTMVTWTFMWSDTFTWWFIKDETFAADATSSTMFNLHWDSIQMHVWASGLIDWHACGEFSISTALFSDWTFVVSAVPLTLVAFTDVAILHSWFSWEVLSVFIVAWAFTNWDADTIVVHDSTFWASTTLDTLFFTGVFEFEGTAWSTTWLGTFWIDHTVWTFDMTISAVISPSIKNDTVLGTGHWVIWENWTWVLDFTMSAEVLHTDVQVLFVINDFVAWVEWSWEESVTDFLGLSSSVGILSTWFHLILVWVFFAGSGFPLWGEWKSISFNVVFWGQEFVWSGVVEVTTETWECTLKFSWGSDVDSIFLIPQECDTIVQSDLMEEWSNLFNDETISVIWEWSDSLCGMKSTTSDQLTFFTINSQQNWSTTSWSWAVMVLNHDFEWKITEASGQNVCTFTMKVVWNTIESSVMWCQSWADTITFVLSAHPSTIDTDALVTITSDSWSWFVFITAELTWTFMSVQALAVMEILTFWTVTAINAMVIITVVWLIPTGLWTWWTTGLVDHTSWTSDFASAFTSPVNMSTMSGTFSEVGWHWVTDSIIGTVSLWEADIFLTGFEVWCWVNNMLAFSVQNVGTLHDSFSWLLSSFFGINWAVWFFSSIEALAIDLPWVGEKWNSVNEFTISWFEIVLIISIENTTETTSLTHHWFVHSEEDWLVTVPLEVPTVNIFLNDDVFWDSLDW
jgi:hypothetical protein